MGRKAQTKKGAASIYIVIFTTTLLGVIALSFVRIMLAESLRTTNYSLSQSAYNSALAGIEDAKIVLLRNQNCISYGSYSTGGRKINKDCSRYLNAFDSQSAAEETAKDCDTVGKFLHNTKDSEGETVIQTTNDDQSYTDAIDQAYTCVKIATYTDDFLAVLREDASTKIIPLRTDNQNTQNEVNRIQIQWFDSENYRKVRKDNGQFEGNFIGMGDGSRGVLKTNKTDYSVTEKYGNSFGAMAIVPPPMQITYIQTHNDFSANDFYSSLQLSDGSYQTDRGTLLLRPTISNKVRPTIGFLNNLPKDSLAYSANKSFNTPIDVYCSDDPGAFGDGWSNYACSADFYIPNPVGGLPRNIQTNYLIVSLPYNMPETDISVKMYHCADDNLPISAELSGGGANCTIRKFANVQPMVDSTGRANDLFRRVESRIELADTSYPISSYALASTRDNAPGVQKNFYVTSKDCTYSSSTPSGVEVKKSDKTSNMAYGTDGVGNPGTHTCHTSHGDNGQ